MTLVNVPRYEECDFITERNYICAWELNADTCKIVHLGSMRALFLLRELFPGYLLIGKVTNMSDYLICWLINLRSFGVTNDDRHHWWRIKNFFLYAILREKNAENYYLPVRADSFGRSPSCEILSLYEKSVILSCESFIFSADDENGVEPKFSIYSYMRETLIYIIAEKVLGRAWSWTVAIILNGMTPFFHLWPLNLVVTRTVIGCWARFFIYSMTVDAALFLVAFRVF